MNLETQHFPSENKALDFPFNSIIIINSKTGPNDIFHPTGLLPCTCETALRQTVPAVLALQTSQPCKCVWYSRVT